jgi:hypothetical protein
MAELAISSSGSDKQVWYDRGVMTEEKAIKLSPNSLNLYRDCPRCFWLQFNKGIKRPSGIFPSLPGGMDGILKVYFGQFRGTDNLPPIIDGRVEGQLLNPLPKSLMHKDTQLQAILHGKLDDALDFGDGTYAPLDHKTRGYAPKEEILDAYQLQMDVYDFLMEQNQMPTRHLAYLVYYYPTPGQLHEKFPFEVVIKPVATDPGRAQQIFADAVKLLRGDMPPASKVCGYCAWSKLMCEMED